jgi:hypothetical protein
MNPAQIRAALRQVPFVPFKLVLADGRSFSIRHPGNLLVSTRSISIAEDPLGQDRIPRQSVSVAPSRVVRIEPLQPVIDAG